MNKKIITKTLLIATLAFSLVGTNVSAKSNLVSNAVPTKTATSTNVKNVSNVAASSTTLADGSSSALTASSGSPAVFALSASDGNLRNITISSNVPVQSYIRPENTTYQNFINFNSGDYRMFNMIQWHFVPGLTYDLVVVPQSSAPVQVTASMSKSTGGASWINIGSNTAPNGGQVEKNMLMGGQTEQYGIAIQAPGSYKIDVKSASNSCTASIINSLNPSQSITRKIGNNGDVYTTITVPTATGTTQNDYVVALTSNDAAGSGAPYTVTITRIN